MVLKSIKCVVVGDGSVGKTSLLTRYTKNDFSKEYTPTVFENESVVENFGNESFNFALFDTAGQEDYEHVRKVVYANTNIFLICFSVDNMGSFVNIREMWIPEILAYAPGVPFVLIGTKSDLRADPLTLERLELENKVFVTKSQGENLAREIKAAKYMETSSFTGENINEIFKEALRIAVTTSAATNYSFFYNICCFKWFRTIFCNYSN